MREFRGRGALVTGGASGIGLAMARAFAERGMHLVLCDVDAAALRSAEAELRAMGAGVLALPLDVTDRAAWREATARVADFGPLHLVCANAGVAPGGAPLTELAPAAWDRIVAVNLTGVFNTVQACTPLVKAHGQGGHLVLTASMAGLLAPAPIADYAVAKYGVVAMGEALRMELAAHRIGVSLLCPGVVATPLVGDSRDAGMAPEAVAGRVVQAVERDELFVFTHADYRPLVQARMAAILSAFAGPAAPGFREADTVMAMMSATAYPPGADAAAG